MRKFSLILMTIICLFVNVGYTWAYEVTVNEGPIKSNKTQTIDGNVTLVFDNMPSSGLYSVIVSNGTTGRVSWTPPTGYSMAVSSVLFKIYSASTFNHYSLTIKDSKNNTLYTNGNVSTSSAAAAFWTTCSNLASDATSVSFTPGKASSGTSKTSNAGIVDFKISYTTTPKSYTVSFDANGGLLGSSSVTVTYDAAMPSATAPTRTGYNFLGYYDAAVGGTQYYTNTMASARTWNKDVANPTLYAHWEAKTYDVTLNDGQGSTCVITATYGSAMPSKTKGGADLSAPEKENFLFTGYFDASTGGKQYYNSDMTSRNNWDKDLSSVTLYAQYDSKYIPNANLAGFSVNNGDSVLVMNAGGTADFTFNNTDGISVAITDNQEDYEVISYSAGRVTANGYGEATITLTQLETSTIAGRVFTYHITVNRISPSVSWADITYYYNNTYNNVVSITAGDNSLFSYSSSNEAVASFADKTVTTYNVNGTTTLTVTAAENYKWSSTTFTKVISPIQYANHVPFTINSSSVYDALFYYRNLSDNHYKTDEGNHGVIQLGPDNAINWDDRITDIHFSGIPDKLSFRAYTSSSIATGVDFRIYESSDGTNWGSEIWKGESKDQTITNIALKPSTRYIRLYYTGNYRGYFEDVTVTELQKFELSKNEIDFNTLLSTAGTPEESFTFMHACAGYDPIITFDETVYDGYDKCLSGNFTVLREGQPVTTVSGTGGHTYGTIDLALQFTSTETGKYAGYVTISDNLNHSARIWVTGERVGKYNLEIGGSNMSTGFYVGQEIPSGISFAYAGSDVEVADPTSGEGSSHFYYVIKNNTVADDATWPANYNHNEVITYDAENNTFHAWNAGTATITFYEVGNEQVNARAPQSYDITVSKVAPEFTQKLSSIAINRHVAINDFVASSSEGLLSWSIPSSVYAAMSNNEIVTNKAGSVTVTILQEATYQHADAETTMDLEITAISGAEWLENPTPSAGRYYLFSVGANQFCKMNSGAPATTDNIAEATLFTITGTSNTDFAYTQNDVTYYLYQDAGNYSENTTPYNGEGGIGSSFAWNIASYNGYYHITSNHKYGKNWAWESNSHISDKDRYITAKGSNINCSCSKESKEYNTANGSWIFVSEGEYAAFRAYLAAQEMLTTESHLSESIKGDLAVEVADKTKGTDDYATWTATLTSLTERCSTYLDNLSEPVALRRDKNDNGYYMFYNATQNARLGDDVQAYTASWNGSNLSLIAVPNQVIPAATVALVYSSTHEEFYYAFEDATTAISGNAFVYHDASYQSDGANGNHTDYILTAIRNEDNNSIIDYYAFCKYVGDAHDALFGDNDKKVLVWTASTPQNAPEMINIVTEENVATALVPVYEGNAQSKQINDNRIYTILGIPVADMSRPGIYIQNGKKYIVH